MAPDRCQIGSGLVQRSSARVLVAWLLMLLACAVPARAEYFTGPSFADDLHGTIIRGDKRHSRVLVTADGGKSWRTLRRVSRAYVNPTGPWFGSRGNVIRRGGPAFTRWSVVAQFRGALLAFGARSTGAWAVTDPCGDCAMRLWHSFDAGRTWWYRTLRQSSRDRGLAHLAFTNAANGVVTYALPNGQMVTRATSNGGHTWTRAVRHGCGRFTTLATARSDGSVWLGCGSEHGLASSQHKEIFVSTDGGRTFALRSRSADPFRPREQRQDPIGNLTQAGSLYGLQPVSQKIAYAEFFKGLGVAKTVDGGRTWRRLRPFAYGDGALFAGIAAHGDRIWAAHFARGLFVSADDRRWRHVLGPGVP